ncbi:uncharacterized protein LOC109823550 [Asparagus officinalis]|uniref:uncharacterized protein LOC109823550 n=1 Tax=Asparagus officinalis TaxID=4686 RepID=UPI00098DEFB2|nr:uncharacterized protein LOC109823550 [Asparagus officinalis]
MIMASRAIKLWRSFARPAAANRGFATATEPRMKAYWPTASFLSHGEQHASKSNKAEFVPVYVALGLIALSVSLGLFTAEHQIAHNPSVRVSKKRREEIPEITDPDRVVSESDQLLNRSLFRKVVVVYRDAVTHAK